MPAGNPFYTLLFGLPQREDSRHPDNHNIPNLIVSNVYVCQVDSKRDFSGPSEQGYAVLHKESFVGFTNSKLKNSLVLLVGDPHVAHRMPAGLIVIKTAGA